MAVNSKLPYWRLSGFYFFYFSALGVFLPYWALYLQQLGLSHAQIGQLMAILPATRVVFPNLWGWLADHTGQNIALIRLSSCLSAASFALVFGSTDFAWLGLTMFLVGLFWNAPMPLFEALTLGWLRQDPHRYTRIRIWGSIGFMVAVFGIGRALDSVLAIACLPQLLFTLFLGMALVSLVLPGHGRSAPGSAQGSTLRTILRRPGVVAFFLACLLVQIAHGPYYTFFSVYLKENGYDAGQTGVLWSLGIIAEMVFFWWCHGLFQRSSLRTIMLAAMAVSTLRWYLIGWWVDSLPLLALAQILHAASFGATHAAAIQFIHRHFAWPHQGKGQALYSSLSFGLGGTLGSYASGELWLSLGPQLIFTLCAALNLSAWLVVLAWVEKPERAKIA